MGIGTLIILAIVFFIGWGIHNNHKKRNVIRYIDERGYERDGYGDLVHRRVAYKYLWDWTRYDGPFGEYDIHHIDGNKRNNSPDNLQILTRWEHERIHGR